MTSQSKVHDPLFHFETHFPERFSRLNLNPEHPQAHRRAAKKRSRTGSRYKTQPITFDEIKEVDEENIEDNNKENLRGQFQAFSRSIDGFVPKLGSTSEDNSSSSSSSSSNNNNNNSKPAKDLTPASPLLREDGVSAVKRERSASTSEASTQTAILGDLLTCSGNSKENRAEAPTGSDAT